MLYIDREFFVYPNLTAPASYWCLGNLKRDGAEAVLECYKKNRSLAQRTRLEVPLCELVKSCGDLDSKHLFRHGGLYPVLTEPILQEYGTLRKKRGRSLVKGGLPLFLLDFRRRESLALPKGNLLK